MNDARNGAKIKAVIESGEFLNKELYNATEFINKKELMRYCVKEAEKSHNLKNSCFMEFGVYQGDSINFMSNLSKTTVYGFDSFEGLPEDWRPGYKKGAFNIDSLPIVNQNVKLIKGWFSDSLKTLDLKSMNPIFIHIDCDLYQSTDDIFTYLGERILDIESVLLFDEFYNYPGWKDGEYKAFSEFVEKYQVKFEYIGYVPTSEQVAVIVRNE